AYGLPDYGAHGVRGSRGGEEDEADPVVPRGAERNRGCAVYQDGQQDDFPLTPDVGYDRQDDPGEERPGGRGGSEETVRLGAGVEDPVGEHRQKGVRRREEGRQEV